MPCSRCNGHNLWDDIMWWGCDDCGWMSDTTFNQVHPKDKFNQPKEKPVNGQEIKEASGS